MSTLTEKQLDYVQAMCITDGKDGDIAREIGVSSKNVVMVLAQARKAVGVKSRVQLAIWAVRVGLA